MSVSARKYQIYVCKYQISVKKISNYWNISVEQNRIAIICRELRPIPRCQEATQQSAMWGHHNIMTLKQYLSAWILISQGEEPAGHPAEGHDGVVLPGGDPQVPLPAFCRQAWGDCSELWQEYSTEMISWQPYNTLRSSQESWGYIQFQVDLDRWVFNTEAHLLPVHPH